MATTSSRAPILRHLAAASQPSALLRARCAQRRWAQVHDVRFLATTQHHRSTLEKYRDKLDAKAREEGHPDINSLKSAYAAKIEALRKKDAADFGTKSPTPPATPPADHPPNTPPPDPTTPRTAARPPASSSKSSSATTGVKPLSDILDLEKARTLPVKELTAIWRLRHASVPSSLCAVIPAATWQRMSTQAASHPQFVLPCPHEDEGCEVHFMQWVPPDKETHTSTVLFTQLAEYKQRGEFAVPHTTVTHHLDLVGDLGVVLMQGRVVDGENGGAGRVSMDSARWLVMCLQKFYGGWEAGGKGEDAARAKERKNLLEWFAKGDERFSVEKLMAEAERM